MHGRKSWRLFSVVKRPEIGLQNLYVVTDATKIGEGFGILGIKNKGPFLVIKET